ncbi:hypothetical protein [Pseudomonas sp. N040]|uniref:hypothetical protein n=1 Tax=Pseudomonas sp. N040 TaxID=2785325 RepID=UPI0018A2E9A3|nr:hypothetical protein [Pseudomonas sp. N040]MBF7731317.1 hypothetical protein [Pseudomonas sp. N040]MBW7014960.1 hypothetical protein [Pseudomonas sp. N040]
MHSTRLLLPIGAALLGLLGACNSDIPPISDCLARDGMQPICQFSNPEDIVLLPDRRTLLVSQMGTNMEQADPGSLVFFDTLSGTLTPAFPADQATTPLADSDNWGSADCPGNPGQALAPHGIALRQRNDQRWQVAAVNHGGRETIEMFELLTDQPAPRLQWRGCVVPPEGSFVNDVALLKNGGFVASQMFDKRSGHLFGMNRGILKAMLGMDTGYVFEWQPASGFRVLEDSRGRFINGVEISANDQAVFANVYFGGEIRKLDRISGKQLGSTPAERADNLAWDDQGRLLAVLHGGTMREQMACMGQPGQTCSLAYSILRIDPLSMQGEVILSHSGAPMGAATVAREVNGNLYLGSFSGDRIVKLKYPIEPAR